MYVVINAAGRILKTGNCPPEMISIQAGDGEHAFEVAEALSDDIHYFKDGFAVAYPEKPGEWAEFNFETHAWFDPRSTQRVLDDVIAAKTQAIGMINDYWETERLKYITNIPGQDAIYIAKENEATAYLSDSAPNLVNYPMIAAEIGVTAPDGYQLSQLWLNMALLWRSVAAQMEGARMRQIEALNI